MFKQNEFAVTTAQQLFNEKLVGQYTTEGKTAAEINQTIEDLLGKFKMLPNSPKIVFNRALYSREDDDTVLERAQFTVRPSAKNPLTIVNLVKKINIVNGANFFDTFIKEMAVFFDTFEYYARLEENITKLNEAFAEVISTEGIPFTVAFTLGNGLESVSDKHVVVGLADETIQSLGNLPLFDEVVEERQEAYKERILETLKELNRPIEIVKLRTIVTKDLGIYQRCSLKKLVRNIVSRKAENVRTGLGYVEVGDTFAVIKKTAVTKEELAELDVEGKLVLDNDKANKKELEAGKVKVVVEFELSPLHKASGVPLDTSLEELVAQHA